MSANDQLANLMSALDDNDKHEITRVAADLAQWLRSGGDMPSTLTPERFALIVATLRDWAELVSIYQGDYRERVESRLHETRVGYAFGDPVIR